MKKANCPGLLDSILDDTIPMHGRMIHGIKNDKLFEESQVYDVHGRVSDSRSVIPYVRLISLSLYEQLTGLDSTSAYWMSSNKCLM